MSRLSKVTIQGDDAIQGDYSSADLDLAVTKPRSYGIGIYNGHATVAGTVQLASLRGGPVTYENIPAGTAIPTCIFTKVLAAGTTATNLTVTLVTRPFY